MNKLAFCACAALAVLAPAALAKPKPAAALAPPPAAPAAPTDADWRTPDPNNLLVIETDRGRILVELNPTVAPKSVEQVRALARQGVYDGRAFFRVIDNFMDQTGDPLDSGVGQSSLPNLQPEFTFRRGPETPFALALRYGGAEQGFIGSMPVVTQTMDLGLLTADHKVEGYGTYCAGVLGLARSDDPASANSQFFLMRTNAESADHGSHGLDKQYAAFGRVLAGQDVVDVIKTGEPVAAPQDKMLTVKVLADIPETSRPKVRVIDPLSPWGKAEIARQVASTSVAEFSICSVKLPVQVQ
jgi:peptidylprolyl isomerase